MKAPKKSSTIPHDEVRLKHLSDPKRARYAIKLALGEFEQDNDVDMLLDTLRLVAQALHEALSPQGNPRLRTFQNVLGSLGLRMTVKPVRPAAKKAARSAA